MVRLAADIEEAAPEFSVASVDSILPIGNQTKASDVVFWHHSPTTEQLLHPLSQQSLCPLPNLWIELFIDVPNDRSRSLEKIREFVNPNCGATCATLAIGIPNAITETMRQRIGKNDPPIHPTIAAEAVDGRPWASPFIGYWPLGSAFVDGRWYRITKNHHLEVEVTDDFIYRLEFNNIIKYF